MERERKIIMVIALMVILFVWGLARCQEARADYWQQNASLLSGTYMLTYYHDGSTDMILALQEQAIIEGFNRTLLFQYMMETAIITINKEFNAAKLVEFLNTEPQTKQPVVLFVKKVDSLGGDFWIQVEMQCVLMPGDMSV